MNDGTTGEEKSEVDERLLPTREKKEKKETDLHPAVLRRKKLLAGEASRR